MDVRTSSFPEEATRRFQYLPSTYGFVGPEVVRDINSYPAMIRVRYHRNHDTVEVLLVQEYMDEEYVATVLHYPISRTALEHRQLAVADAHTTQDMCAALDSQCTAVHDLLRVQNTIARR